MKTIMEIKNLIKYKDKNSFIKDFSNDRMIMRCKYSYPIIQFMKTSESEVKLYLSSSICAPVELTYVEKTMTSIYSKYIDMIEKIIKKSGSVIPVMWRFILMCAPDDLILKQVVTGKDVFQDNDSLKFWADTLGIKYNSTVFDSSYMSDKVPYSAIADILYDNNPIKKERICNLLNITKENNTDYYMVIKDKSDISITIEDKLDNISKESIHNMNSEIIYIIFKDYIKYLMSIDITQKIKDIKVKQTPIQIYIDLLADTFVDFCKNGEFSNILESNELSKYDININFLHNNDSVRFLSKKEYLRTVLKYIIKILCTNYYTLRTNNIYDDKFIQYVNTAKETLQKTIDSIYTDNMKQINA